VTARSIAGAALALLFVAPLAALALGAFGQPGAPPPNGLGLLPDDPTLRSFSRAFSLGRPDGQLLNSVIVVALAVPLTLVVASWAGLGMLMLGTRARRLAVGATLVALMVPLSALWVPRFVLYDQLGLIGTLLPLVAPALVGTTPLLVLLFHWSFRRIPPELFEAARLEGLGPLATWWRVAMPLARPTTFAVAALAFIFHWGNFIDALLYVLDPGLATLPLGLGTLRALGGTELPTLLAGALIATLPPVIAFVSVQRWLERSARTAAATPAGAR